MTNPYIGGQNDDESKDFSNKMIINSDIINKYSKYFALIWRKQD